MGLGSDWEGTLPQSRFNCSNVLARCRIRASTYPGGFTWRSPSVALRRTAGSPPLPPRPLPPGLPALPGRRGCDGLDVLAAWSPWPKPWPGPWLFASGEGVEPAERRPEGEGGCSGVVGADRVPWCGVAAPEGRFPPTVAAAVEGLVIGGGLTRGLTALDSVNDNWVPLPPLTPLSSIAVSSASLASAAAAAASAAAAAASAAAISARRACLRSLTLASRC